MSGIMQEVATFVILGDSLQARAKIKNSAPQGLLLTDVQVGLSLCLGQSDEK